jgi:hypothetical protein
LAQAEGNLINNKTIKFDDFKLVPSLTGPKVLVDLDYIDISYNDTLKNYILNLKYENWVRLLSCDSTDWAATLILNNIFGINFHNKSIDSYPDWVDIDKKKDLKFWKKYLANPKNFQKIAAVLKSNESISDRFANGELGK